MTDERTEAGDGLERLLEPSSPQNERLEQALSGLDDYSDGVTIPPLQDRRCALCTLDDYPYSEGEQVMRATDDYLVVEPEDDNSHDRRTMLVLRRHRSYPSDDELEGYARDALETLVTYTGEDPVAVYADMNTFTHPHIIASDLEPGDPDEADLASVNNYIVFQDGDLDDPVAEHYGDSVGKALLERFYDAATE